MDDRWSRNQHIIDDVIKSIAEADNGEGVEVEIDYDKMNDVFTDLEQD